ncbi:hypothetical protein O181_043628 [Austropuccinia psidii MF-1]|uniref:Uncharacterized protein n=1 Tax=Austropuccinia psidii MF-1 TaxID=1389203 RepID=A0A9Q3DLR5_9BASI|nr:hypothetical protein [Austropuccinia psidii MF-1]
MERHIELTGSWTKGQSQTKQTKKESFTLAQNTACSNLSQSSPISSVLPLNTNSPDLSNDDPPPEEQLTKKNIPSVPALPQYKGYSWIPEGVQEAQNKIVGDVGDSRNILEPLRRPKHNANLANHLSPDPKPSEQAISGHNCQHWIQAINSKLENMTRHQVWSPTTPDPNVFPLSSTWVFKQKTN